MRYASKPVFINGIRLDSVRDVLTRPRDPMQSNDFSFSRFLVPWMCNYEGTAVFMDCDMLVLDDITKLFDLAVDDYAVQVVKHDHAPKNTTKYLGTTQTQYAKKNWSSVMLFNNAACKALTPEYVNTATGLDLHQFKWLEADYRIGDLPLEWNYLVDYYPTRNVESLSNLHFTEGGPYFDEYRDCSYADVWWAEYDYMRTVADATERVDVFGK
jgi:lipopolysaccharide biosynthesis glycosyltransferase